MSCMPKCTCYGWTMSCIRTEWNDEMAKMTSNSMRQLYVPYQSSV